MKTLTALVLFCSVLAFFIGRSSVTRLELAPDVKNQLDKWVDEQMNKEKPVDGTPPLTEDEFKKMQEYFREQKRLREANRPAPQGDYQWDGGYSFNGGFGEYQALFLKGKLIGGMFAPGSGFPNEYHSFSEDGGVGKKCDPPVPHMKPRGKQ